MTKLFKIYLGLNNPATNVEYCQIEIIKEINEIVDCGTIYVANGLWQGKKETTLVIEIIEDKNFSYDRIKNIASYLRKKYNQDSVLVTTQDVGVEFFNSRELKNEYRL